LLLRMSCSRLSRSAMSVLAKRGREVGIAIVCVCMVTKGQISRTLRSHLNRKISYCCDEMCWIANCPRGRAIMKAKRRDPMTCPTTQLTLNTAHSPLSCIPSHLQTLHHTLPLRPSTALTTMHDCIKLSLPIPCL
jgi:hypothetical protein